MLVISILFALIMVAGIYFYWKKNRAAPVNRYRKVAPTYHTTADENDALDLAAPALVEKKPESAASSPVLKTSSVKQDCIVALYLMAPEGSAYGGYELLQALLSAGLRYGKHRIFHRHAHKDGRGDVLFHCASAVSPGTFDLTKMGAFSCRGLSLFFSASDVDDPLATFDCLLETLDQLVEDIGGQVLDEKREVFTKDRMVKYRQQIRAIENGRVTADLFAID